MPTPASKPQQPARGSSQARVTSRELVLRAARECFLRDGLKATTMEDVARAAGISRQMVYKLYLGRRELVEEAAAERILEIADDISTRMLDGQPSIESFVAASVQVIEALRADDELGLLTGPDSPITFHDAVWLDAAVKRGREFWQPWLAQSRRDRNLREDLTDDDLSDWLQIVYSSLIVMHEMRPADDQAVVERFVLTSLKMVRAEQ